MHRDLKPPTILFDHVSRALITDFGLSVVDNGRLRMIAGTEGYQAPEMLIGSKYGTAVDIYSFGCIMRAVLGDDAMQPSALPEGTFSP